MKGVEEKRKRLRKKKGIEKRDALNKNATFNELYGGISAGSQYKGAVEVEKYNYLQKAK